MMSAVSLLFAGLLAALPNALIAIGLKLFTEKFLQAVLEKIIVKSVKAAAKISTNTLDDELAAEVEKRLTEAPKGEQ